MACLETDFLIGIIKKDKDAMSKLEELTARGEELSITPISISELFLGAFKSTKRDSLQKVEQLSSFVKLLDYDFYSAREAGRILAELEKKGSKIGDFDTLTAAIALRHGQKVITRNVKHFKQVEGLVVESW